MKKRSTDSTIDSLFSNGKPMTPTLPATPKKNTVSPKSSQPSDLQSQKEKARWNRILRVYGITKEQYEELDLGHCPICLRSWSDTVRPVVDHDHKDGWIRGLLCFYCNHRVVGRNRDSSVMRRVADYLGQSFKYTVPPKPKKKRKKKNDKTTSTTRSTRSR